MLEVRKSKCEYINMLVTLKLAEGEHYRIHSKSPAHLVSVILFFGDSLTRMTDKPSQTLQWTVVLEVFVPADVHSKQLTVKPP